MSELSFAAWMQRTQARTESALEQALPPGHIVPHTLHGAMRYAVLGGGKRVRPLLCHAAGALTGANPEHLDRVACALELIHAYSLVHDDMPCMDDDALRRGKPTVHVQFDEATALLVGDALQSLAFQLIATPAFLPPSVQLNMIALLAQASGSRGMAGGQAIDLAAVGKTLELTELEHMHIHKTGALIRASVLLGAQCGTHDAQALERLDHFGKLVGLLFQVVDDLLDCEQDTATLGKTAGKDAAANKPTYVSLMGVADARRYAADLLDDALACLPPLGDPPRTQRLEELARFVLTRQF